MKYEKFKKLPLKQRIIIVMFWSSLVLIALNFYGYLGAEMLEKLLK